MLFNRCAFYVVLVIAIAASGCAYNVPIVADPVKDMRQSRLVRKKMPIKVGMYLSDDLKNYIYEQQRMGTTFQMNVGKYLLPIAMKMGSAIFDKVTLVNSLPPYDGNYRPDVEAVIRPEVLSCYGDAVGAFSGYIKAKTKLRVTAYDLGGNALWQDEATGESKSKHMDFVKTWLTDMEEVGKTGYRAAFSAATQIINDFYARPPQELLSLLEIKKAENLRNRGALPDFELFKNLYEKGQFQYDKKNYYQSLYLFAKASNIASDEPAALFYTGASYTHTGDKSRALKQFEDIIKKQPYGPEARDSKKWIQRLDDPLEIGVFGSRKSDRSALNDHAIKNALINSGMYEVMNTAKLTPPASPIPSPDFSKFLDTCYKKGIKVVIWHDIDSSSKKPQYDFYSGEDVATEHRVKISAKVYSTKKKRLTAELQINERSSTIQEQTAQQEMETRQQLLQSGAKKLALQLLKNDIF
ncbi:MAG: tetratricopeptide repeat protein [Methylobacter sp.]